jgi:serine/threonine protein kinase
MALRPDSMHPTWLETEDLITATCEQPAEQRERFVREHCDDPALREAMAALVRTGSPRATEGADANADLPTGTHVGPYVILHRLGHGGMGEVFLGRDPRLDRLVALKCLFASPAGGETLRARIIHEARAAARISHAHVAAVHDVLEHDGRAFIVMEYVEGENLAVLLKREALPPDRVIAIGRQIASALAAAHAKGIIHRDLKPANVQVTSDGSIKILDFGIATALASISTTTTTTSSGAATATEPPRAPVPGTPAYMSPEHLLGRTVDERSDLFSLGVILFEMATGRRPFSSSNPFDVLMAAVRKPPRADSVDPKVPAPLANVIARALAADPAERFQSAIEMSAALDTVRVELFHTTADERTDRPVPQRSVLTRARRALTVAVSVPAVLWLFGRLTSIAFNAEMGRYGAFAEEPAWEYLVLGARSLVGPAFYVAVAATAWWSASFWLRVLALAGPVARSVDSVTTRWSTAAARLKLNDPIVMAQALTALGVVAVAAVFWFFGSLIDAWTTNNLGTAPADALWRLGESNKQQKLAYRAVLTVLFVVFFLGFVRVLALRRRLGTKAGRGPVATLAMVVIMLLVMNELPYRLLWRSFAIRGEYEGARCYVIGEDTSRALLFCPDIAPPRTMVVAKNDPRFKSSGAVERIFNPR